MPASSHAITSGRLRHAPPSHTSSYVVAVEIKVVVAEVILILEPRHTRFGRWTDRLEHRRIRHVQPGAHACCTSAVTERWPRGGARGETLSD